ncbi:family 16 glycoside hydrolase [Stieleria varia]|uniref:3-keto-alpha-glucoside-1,2-lyase/3-keto-2-hydroxy-glucal hydratase domain-containing protein n=1 Tax=Stieleria varia TaxID=2528005 RepID=A0A5C6B540_9BACT|nr:family 16 glycoside hydrolase [Stieleria varia]TWU06396.1 hypothetical protein Pla52n_21170 [Stieleria varia]
MLRSTLVFAVALLVSHSLVSLPAYAEKNASLTPKLASVGSPVVQETFDGEKLDKVMSAVKGEWKLVDGALHGKELAADKHAAVLNFQKKNHNSVVQFSFKFDDNTKGLHFSLNHSGGHLFRVAVSPDKLTVNLDKDKKDPKSKAIALGSAKGDFKSGQWHTMMVEMVGDKVVVQTDAGASVSISHAKLDTDKPNYRFVMRGNSLSIDDLTIWEVN